jgi:predicted RNase H-related nuclease YkuK (DUF458 family)
MKSIGAMIKQLEPLVGTTDLNAWEQRFIENIILRSNKGATSILSERQVERINELYVKHFGDAET